MTDQVNDILNDILGGNTFEGWSKQPPKFYDNQKIEETCVVMLNIIYFYQLRKHANAMVIISKHIEICCWWEI